LRRALLEMGGHYIKVIPKYIRADLKKQLAFAKRMLRTERSIDKGTFAFFLG
jgi:hypothetical protein